MAKHMSPDLNALIADTVRNHMPNSAIERVLAEEALDHDGDPVIRVTIIFDGRKAPLDVAETVSISRHLVSALEEAGSEAFPIPRFIEKSEAGDIAPAAA